jgi:gliding motility-associated-like protein
MLFPSALREAATNEFKNLRVQTRNICLFFTLLCIQQVAHGQVHAHNHGTGRAHPNSQMAVYADWTNTGSFVGNKGTAFFYGSQIQNIFGTNAMDLGNLVLRNPSGLFIHISVTVNERMTFDNGLLLTPRHLPDVNLNFSKIGSYEFPTDRKHVNGYCGKFGRDSFMYPIGGGGRFRPAGTGRTNSDNSFFKACYFRLNPNFTSLPVGAPFFTNSRDQNLRRVSDVEYWDVKGRSTTQITLTWNPESDINVVTGGELDKVVVAGWNGRQWVNLGNTAMKGDFQNGQVRSRNVVPDSFLVYTLAWGAENTRCVANAPRFDIGNTVNLCKGGSLTLNALSQGYQFQNFAWNNGATTPTINVTEAGKYWVTVWDSCGSPQTDTLYVRALDRLRIAVDSATCNNIADGKVRILGDTTRMSLWINNQQTELRTLGYMAAGTYNLRLRSGNYCDLDTTITVLEPPKNRVDIGADTLQVRLNQTIVLNAKPVGNFNPIVYRWTPNDAMSCYVCQATTAIVNRDVITYQVTAVDAKGCQTTDQITVFTSNQRPRYAIYVPNVFKPEQEEYAVLGNPSQVTVKQMRIFDRWGELVFEAKDFKPDGSVNWNGTFRGKHLPTGAFVVTVEAEFIDGTVQRIARDITLLR